MAADAKLHFTCVSGRDRYECLQKINRHEADLGAVDPEDMYIASKLPGEDFKIIKEVRTKEEPTEEFRYEAVAVIHKNLNINSIQGLKGLKSCHTGVGRNVGYKIPITKLTKMGLIDPLSDTETSARENELKALSQLFSKACLVGTWSPDPEINKRLKTEYSNLCQMCEDPAKCDYPDNFSGYDGALRCLTQNGGDVAWTKVYYVKKHFGMPIGSGTPGTPQSNPEDYVYFCPDGTKRPITGPACRWAARPWQGFMINGELTNSVDDIRHEITLADEEGEKTHAEWLTSVLQLNNKTVAVDNAAPISPQAYLDKANYTDVIARASTGHAVRFCVITQAGYDKCLVLKESAFTREVRPPFDCVKQASMPDCLRAIRDNGADIITLDGGEVATAEREYNLRPIIEEVYGAQGALYYAVAIVKKDSTYQSLADLRGAKSCHTGFGRTAGYNIPLYALISKNLIGKNACPYPAALASFFSGGSCLPGALATENNPDGNNPASLCQQCVGNVDGSADAAATKCVASADEAYFGYTGAFRCLASGAGDVAFVKHTTVAENTDGHNTAAWAAALKSDDFELLCLDGGRRPVADFANCHLAQVPPHMVVTANDKTDVRIDSIKQAVLAAGKMYGKRPDLFQLFGDFEGKKDLLFKNSATALESVSSQNAIQLKYKEIVSVIRSCDTHPAA